ncbi:unnamed protein product [Meganyctiphanes norvegica]|uniref:Uncharacterized protein n=1 Tax=Meganyctiphanes norvegica TaxID=48144 RepID=A0AAV2SRP6_MEGNR
MLPPSKTLFVLPKQPNVCNGPPSTAFGLSSNCILCLGLPPKDCNVSKFIASGLLSKFPFPGSPPLTFGRPSTYVCNGPPSTVFGFGRPSTYVGNGPPSTVFGFGRPSTYVGNGPPSFGVLSKLPLPWSPPMTFGRPSTFIVSPV